MGVPEASGVPFGRYRLLERLGEGGMAIVYRALAEGPDGFRRSVVIKRVRPSLSSEPEFARMLAAEARVSALLHHPNIVQVHELGVTNGEQYLVMEYVDGLDLNVLMRHNAILREPMPLGLACYIVSRIAAALAYAHDLRDGDKPLLIVHRDISPSNIMVTRDGSVKLVDFGIAKATASLRHEQTVTGVIRGKLSYLSPEQAASQTIDRRSDIFALGIVLHELLTGRRLFRGSDDLATINLVREAEVPALESLRDGVPPALAEISRKMLAKDREQRYAHCDQIVGALAPLVHQLHGDEPALRAFVDRCELRYRHHVEAMGGSYEPSPIGPTATSTDQTKPQRRPLGPPGSEDLRERSSRQRMLWIGVVLCLLAFAGGAAVQLWRRAQRAAAPVHPAAVAPTPVPTPPPTAAPTPPTMLGGRLDPAPVQPEALKPAAESTPRHHHRDKAAPSSKRSPAAEPSSPRRDDELRPF